MSKKVKPELSKKDKQAKMIYDIIIIILCVMFVIGFIYGINKVVQMEGQFPPNILTDGEIKVPETNEDVIRLLNSGVKDLLEGKPKFQKQTGFDVLEDDSHKTESTFSESFMTSAQLVKTKFCEKISSNFEAVTTDFNEDFTKHFVKPEFKTEDIKSFSCSYIYYICASCGNYQFEPADHCEKCGYEYPYLEKYLDEYDIVVELNPDDYVVKNYFSGRTNEEAINLIKGEYEDYMKINSLDIQYESLRFQFKANRNTGRISYMAYEKIMPISANLGFINSYKDVGTGDLKFTLKEDNMYAFTWPGIGLSTYGVSLEPGGNSNTIPILTCSDPKNTKVTWSSTDESIVTVDQEGYFKATKKIGDAQIIASMEFNGKKYEARCNISVNVPVESLDINKRKVTLKQGETFKLIGEISPKDATNKNIEWHTEDEKIATIDENGNIKAVSPGNVTVYGLSESGYYKASCKVTVE